MYRCRVPFLIAAFLLLTATGSARAAIILSVEDDGAIPLANNAGAGNVFTLVGELGDGPFGLTSGDFDVYRFPGLAAGVSFVAAAFSQTDPVLLLYSAAGALLFKNDDAFGAGGSPNGFDSYLNVAIPSAGDYFLFVRGFGTGDPDDPFSSSSGFTIGASGPYSVEVSIGEVVVPEPASLALFGLGLAGLGMRLRARKS